MTYFNFQKIFLMNKKIKIVFYLKPSLEQYCRSGFEIDHKLIVSDEEIFEKSIKTLAKADAA